MRVRILFTAVLLSAATATTAHADWPFVQSHRGGSVRAGVATFAEESMPAFRSAWKDEHTVLELDVKLSADRVPVVIHDATLDRTTACSGRVDARTWKELRDECPSDVLGIDGFVTAPAVPPVPMTRLRDVLAYAKKAHAPINLEIKNIPGDADFDSSPAFATTICQVIKDSKLPLDQLIVQSFYPPNLDVAKEILPGVQTAYLTFAGGAPMAAFSKARGYEWWSPSWPVQASDVQAAHAVGVKVVPWTIDDAAGVKAAADAGVDALITNDPVMAKHALGR